MNLEDLKPYQDLINRNLDNKDFVKTMEKYQKAWGYYWLVRNADREDIEKNIHKVEDLNVMCIDGSLPPLFCAVGRQDLDLAKLLVEKGCDVNAFCCGGYGTVMDFAITTGMQDFVDFFKSKKALTKEEMVTHNRLILAAITKGNPLVADEIVQTKYSGNLSFILRHALMDCAVRKNNPQVAEYVFSKGQNMHYDLEKRRNITWLHKAADLNADKVIPCLVQNGFNPNELALHRVTPLYFAVRAGAKEAVKALVKEGADVQKTYIDGQTLMHIAAQRDNPQLIEMLAEFGLDVLQTDENGKTPLDYAYKSSAMEASATLIEVMEKQVNQLQKQVQGLVRSQKMVLKKSFLKQNEG